MMLRDNRTSFGLDRFGAYTSIGHWVPEAGDHNTTLIYRNQHSQPTQIITPRGDNTQHFWSGVKLDSIRNNHSGQRIRFGYTPTYNDVDSIFGDVAKVRNFWNAGRMDSTRLGPQSSQSPRTRFEYDTFGRVTLAHDRQGTITRYVYGSVNPWQNLDTVTIGPRRIVYEYDSYGRLASVRDPAINTVHTTYDDRNRVVRTVEATWFASADTTVFTHDDAALKSWVLDAKGQLYEMSYNALGWLVSRTDASGRSDLYAYDLNGNLARWTNRRDQTTSFTYDVLNRLTSRNAAGTVTSYATDIYDRFTTTSTAASIDTMYFDIHGRDSLAVSVRAGFAYRTLSTYDIRGRRVQQSVTSPSAAGSVNYGYDNVYDRLSFMSGPHGNTTFTFNNVGRLVQTTFPTTPFVTAIGQTFSSIGRRASVSPSGPVTLQRAYVQDENGRASEQWKLDQSEVRTLGYWRNRLENWTDDFVTDGQCWDDVDWGNVCSAPTLDTFRSGYFTWDRVGNPTEVGYWTTQSGSVSTNPVVQTGNRLASIWDMAMTYDNDGNMTSRSTATENRLFYWNAIGQLDSVRIGNQLSSYAYDGWDRRVSKLVAGERTNFLWDGDQIIVETDAQHNVLARYGLAGSRPIYLRRGTDTRYFVQENPGSVTGLFTVSQQVTHTYEYLPFGERIGADAPETFENPLLFAGQYFDRETGLYYMRARYYDPKLFRFISEDPIGLTSGINPYVYAENDPINLRDPSGLEPCDEADSYLEVVPDASSMVGYRFEFTCKRWPFSTSRASGFSSGFGSRGYGFAGFALTRAANPQRASAPQSRSEDPCQSYEGGGGAAILRGICSQVHSPSASSESNTCAAQCLEDKWLSYTSQPNWLGYLFRDHGQCYSRCEYTKGQFLIDFYTGAGSRGRPNRWLNMSWGCIAEYLPPSICRY